MRVMIVDDDAQHRQYLAEVVTGWDYSVEQAGDGEEALELAAERPVGIILADLIMPRMDGFELLRQLRTQGHPAPTILMTAFGSLDKALRTIHELDGFWFLEKPIDLTALKLLLQRAVTHRRLANENEELRRRLSYSGVLGDLVGESAVMQQVFALIRQVAPTTAAVLITGESGTGKELVARAIHAHSRRNTGPFVAINCATLPETLVESEIFGHEKGAFTGAVARRTGAIESAEGGTLFLDELGEMPLPMQAKLLRVLEDLRFRRVGGKQELLADVRIIAATNRNPEEAVAEGRLRKDIYYRLNVFQIHLPPLRERRSDIPSLIDAIIADLNKKHGTAVQGASPSFKSAMEAMEWYGNVRELRNALERAVIMAGKGVLQPKHVACDPPRRPAKGQAEVVGSEASVGVAVGMSVSDAERLLIKATLQRTGNNKTQAASLLGISAKTLHLKLRQYREESSG